MSRGTAPIYQLKITLKDSNPPIWRRVLISSDTTLTKLHQIIQIAMGWYDSHLHAFEIHGERYSAPMPGDPTHLQELHMKSTSRVKLNTLITAKDEKFHYDYDFGDSWGHEIVLEKILPADPKQELPVCIVGKRACPPEDIGGVWGYEDFLKTIIDPKHPDHAMHTEWIGEDFDPEAFDLDAVNGWLKRVK